MVCAFGAYPLKWPINVEILLESFKMIIFFEILKPEVLLPKLGIYLTIEEILGI